jgi:protein involved in polysaccharide export with SLBB domain
MMPTRFGCFAAAMLLLLLTALFPGPAAAQIGVADPLTGIMGQGSGGAAGGGDAQLPATGTAGGLGGTSVPPVRIMGSPSPGEGADSRADVAVPVPLAVQPREPSRFERYVAEVAGRTIPLFGAAFFERPQFRPGASGPVSDDYTVGPGDELLVRGWGSIDIDVRAVVDRNGAITIPRVGAVQVAGVNAGSLESVVRHAVSRYYRNFELNVTVGRLKGTTVFVTGNARTPGTYTLGGVATIITAVIAAGGPNGAGSIRSVQLRRGGQTVAELDMYAFIAGGDKTGDVRLRDGDVVHLPAAFGHVALLGELDQPAIYEIKSADESVQSLLQIAGGLPVLADPRRALLERIDPTSDRSRSVMEFAVGAFGDSTKLQDGDILTILSNAPRFSNAVTLRGNVDQTLRVPFRAGMRITDLIPNREFLLSRNSLRKLNAAVQPPRAPDPWTEARAAEEKERSRREAFIQRRAQEGRDLNDDVAPLGAADVVQQTDPTSRRSLESRAAAARDHEAAADRERTRARVAEIGNRLDPVNFEYASVERYERRSLRTRVLTFNLGRALDDPTSTDNLVLEPGDIVTIFSQDDVQVPIDRRPAFVTVEGEVLQPGVYEVRPGETLADVVRRAGGLTSNAYLFGTELYRERVRLQQQANLEKVLRRVEQESTAGTASALAGLSAAESGIAQVRLQAQQAAQKEMVERLRNLRATGRISLNLPTDVASLATLPQLKLENLDRIVVPARPDFVNVYGAVNTESSLVWRADAGMSEYLAAAGLGTYADKGEIFVIRADGSVASGNSGHNPLRGFRIMPGDNIVVPEKADKEPGFAKFTRGLRDWAQILAGFGLAVAALNNL